MSILKFCSKDGKISFEYNSESGEIVVNRSRNHSFVPCFVDSTSDETGDEPKFLGVYSEATGDFYSYPDGILLHSSSSIDNIEI